MRLFLRSPGYKYVIDVVENLLVNTPMPLLLFVLSTTSICWCAAQNGIWVGGAETGNQRIST